MRVDLGGKGINVSRALRNLGIESEIITVLAGTTGEILKKELTAQSYISNVIQGQGETRQNITLIDRSTGLEDKYNEEGASLDQNGLEALLSLVKRLTSKTSLWAFCGRLPKGADSNLYRRLIELVQSNGGKAFLDTTGSALNEGIKASPFCVRVTHEELYQVSGGNFDLQEGLGWLHEKGISLAALSAGSDGVAISYQNKSWQAVPPDIIPVSTVGAGDASMAGLIWGILENCSAADLAIRAAACGTACVLQQGTGMGERDLIIDLVNKTIVNPI
jgi:1-phosphofructokinase